ncbi:MAG: hypothetical protein KZQ58_04275 [gamma proteobacterium symbiont of Bathyaustriella thionipta]|nr:hypothetical protein [gamma proteobacterium symbiont of Bathyaustriella thionipta]
MLKRLVIICLIFCTLGYTTAWAFDSHPEKTEQASPGVAESSQAATDMNHHQPACDHCCHAGAHMLGLCSVFSQPCLNTDGTVFLSYRQSMPDIYLSPSEYPPRA